MDNDYYCCYTIQYTHLYPGISLYETLSLPPLSIVTRSTKKKANGLLILHVGAHRRQRRRRQQLLAGRRVAHLAT